MIILIETSNQIRFVYENEGVARAFETVAWLNLDLTESRTSFGKQQVKTPDGWRQIKPGWCIQCILFFLGPSLKRSSWFPGRFRLSDNFLLLPQLRCPEVPATTDLCQTPRIRRNDAAVAGAAWLLAAVKSSLIPSDSQESHRAIEKANNKRWQLPSDVFVIARTDTYCITITAITVLKLCDASLLDPCLVALWAKEVHRIHISLLRQVLGFFSLSDLWNVLSLS